MVLIKWWKDKYKVQFYKSVLINQSVTIATYSCGYTLKNISKCFVLIKIYLQTLVINKISEVFLKHSTIFVVLTSCKAKDI